ncbi:hypothetical protein LSM04_005544 [Trypanosoma melophagium]|uniref:uncharacterized protein n=1 Tax=Trypanosoma melophagium TaxID=715481 RepID=UPI00351A0C97|nr:hypothetical protein LSM04_005544 [Trypanosoma melophagium]
MTSIAIVAKDNNNNSNNPFEQLRPSPRSEEDDIRKGIFGQALRLLHAASDEEKLRWRRAIEEATAPKQPAASSSSSRRKKKEKEEKSETVSPIEPTTLAVKRTREEVEEEKKEREEENKNGDRTNEETEKENAKSDVPTSSNGCSETNVPESDVRQPSDLEFIAAYLRTLLEKVVGLSLQELNVDALRVLCVMLGIPLPATKNKMIHYSILASFYYTHCEKLGKRVSSSHHLNAQLKRDEEMYRKIYTKEFPSNGGTSAGKTATSSTTITTETTSTTKKSSRNSAGKNDMLRVVDGNVSPSVNTPRSQQKKSTATQPPSQSNNTPGKTKGSFTVADSVRQPGKLQKRQQEEEEYELEVRHNSAVFTQQTLQQADQSHKYNNNMDGEWSLAQLEQRVASVVHLYDPVTTAVVVKKLAQMGYRSADAAERVESILHSFHQRQFVFYDNGIAYLL